MEENVQPLPNYILLERALDENGKEIFDEMEFVFKFPFRKL